MNCFLSEEQLVNTFLEALTVGSPWGALASNSEFDFRRGRTDVVAVDSGGRVYAFEAKLSKWKDAMRQAYRNTCFAHQSYVLLPKETAIRASRCLNEFSRRGVGICYIDGGVVILQEAEEQTPIQPWLSNLAARHATERIVTDARR